MSPYATAAATAPVVQFESARWLASLLSDLRSLEGSGKNIPGLADLRISTATADHVRRLLTMISTALLPEPTLAAFSGGGVALTCNFGNRELTLTAYPDHQDFVFMVRDEHDDPTYDAVVTLDQPDRLRDMLKTFLANPAR
jgi:hypothetical protein